MLRDRATVVIGVACVSVATVARGLTMSHYESQWSFQGPPRWHWVHGEHWHQSNFQLHNQLCCMLKICYVIHDDETILKKKYKNELCKKKNKEKVNQKK
jgi:hypothetical protein